MSSRGAKQHGDLIFPKKMATLPPVTHHDNVTKLIAFILEHQKRPVFFQQSSTKKRNQTPFEMNLGDFFVHFMVLGLIKWDIEFA